MSRERGHEFDGVDDDGDGTPDDQPDEVDEQGLVHYTMIFNSPVGIRTDPRSDQEGYRAMTCDPPDECIESTDATSIRFMFSSGPSRMRPGETHRLVLGIVFADAVWNPSSIPVSGSPMSTGAPKRCPS